MSPFEWSESAVGGQGMSRRGSALVISGEPRTAVAVTLVLQEMDLAVDLGYEATFAARWMRHARYDVVVLGALDVATPLEPEFVADLRRVAPEARLLILGDHAWTEGEADRLGVELVSLPLQVNDLVDRLLPAA